MDFALVDSHCHLAPNYFPEGASGPMSRARASNIVGFVVVGVGSDLSAARHAVELSKTHPDEVTSAVGIHPHEASALNPEMFDELSRLAADPAVSAVGEIGLDYHYEHSPRDVQRRVFAELIALARQVRKPIVVHTRAAAEETLEILEAEGARDAGGVIHCFSEDRAFAERALALGFYLSFSGIVTFKNSVAIQDVAAWAPSDRILVETDSPYLAPVPLRGKPCEPSFLIHTARRVAELRSCSLEQLAAQTTDNASRLFGRTWK